LDGALILRLRVADTSELRRWVLQFAAEAEVLSPPSLRAAIGEALRAAAAAYRDRPRGARR
jgi:predicted DNA-binding transcriptional regulator YafY